MTQPLFARKPLHDCLNSVLISGSGKILAQRFDESSINIGELYLRDSMVGLASTKWSIFYLLRKGVSNQQSVTSLWIIEVFKRLAFDEAF